MSDKFTCPRRIADGRDREGVFHHSGPNLDEYKSYRGEHEVCSYCGSLSGDRFMELVKSNTITLESTDKSYKFYVEGIPHEGDPNELMHTSSSSHPHEGYKAWKDLNRSEKKAVKKRSGFTDRKKWYYGGFKPVGTTERGKFYTHHLNPNQGDEFILLWRAGKVSFSYPPYVRLYIPHTEAVEKV